MVMAQPRFLKAEEAQVSLLKHFYAPWSLLNAFQSLRPHRMASLRYFLLTL